MRIISDFRDYYDSVQARGQDDTVVYLRTRKEIKLGRRDFPFPLLETVTVAEWRWRGRGVALDQFVVGFCGKVYPILRLRHERPSGANVAWCYGLADVDAFVKRHFKRHEIEAYRSNPRGWKFPSAWNPGQRRAKFAEYFDFFAAKRSAFGEMFVANQSPLFVASVSSGGTGRRQEFKIAYNESLRELEFFRVVDTFTAYQEIHMYLGGMARPNKPIPAISDKDMVSIKGFDKWSFRKPPKERADSDTATYMPYVLHHEGKTEEARQILSGLLETGRQFSMRPEALALYVKVKDVKETPLPKANVVAPRYLLLALFVCCCGNLLVQPLRREGLLFYHKRAQRTQKREFPVCEDHRR